MPTFKVLTEFPIATESRDHLQPGGVANDNSRYHPFNDKLYKLFDHPLFVMDMGCAGGGFVKDCLDDGNQAIGLEGSDYAYKVQRAEWATIPNNLFLCDITKPFQVLYEGEQAQFDTATMWEVCEHLDESAFPTLCETMRTHLKDNGLWIMSVSTQHGYHHITVRPKAWWVEMFEKEGFVNDQALVDYFDGFVRDQHRNAPDSFPLVLKKKG